MSNNNNMKIDPEEIKRLQREKELKILKAQNEMMQMGFDKIKNMQSMSELDKMKVLSQLEEAEKENIQKGKYTYGVDEKDLENIKYDEASEYHKRKYMEKFGNKKNTTAESEDVVEMATVAKKEITKRRRHTSRKEKKEADEKTALEVKVTQQPNTENKEETKEVVNKIEERKRNDEISHSDYDFDFSSIPDYIQYDIIPLPSKGECYSHKIGRVPVAYLTASDENLIASPNMYRDGKIIDVILSRKILDKRIKPSELCRGDRDAIVLWLRATGYGTKFPITATNPDTNKQYSVDFDLSTLDYFPFSLKGDENGYFDYTTESGTEIKFKVLSYGEEEDLKKKISDDRVVINAFDAFSHLEIVQDCINTIGNFNEDDSKTIKDCVADLKDIINENVDTKLLNKKYEEVITKQMEKYTVSINGNTDKEYIRNFIENMRAKDAYGYRTYVLNNQPGVDFNITINIPESDGGGSFNTFLATDYTIFLNI